MRITGALVTKGNLALDFSSIGVEFYSATDISIHIVMTGAPVGTFTLQGSNDAADRYDTVVNWIEIPNTSLSVSSPGQAMMDMSNITIRWLRVVYIATSGTGLVDINFFSTVLVRI